LDSVDGRRRSAVASSVAVPGRLDLVRQRLAGQVDRDLAVLQRREQQQLDDTAFQFTHRTADMLGDEPDDVVRDRHVEMVLLGLLPQDRRAMFEVGLADVDDHPPLEAGDEAGLEARDGFRWPVGRQDDLPAPSWRALKAWKNSSWVVSLPSRKCTSSTSRMSRSFRLAPVELGHRPRLDARDDVVRELLGADVDGAQLRLAFQDGLGDRLHQVRLAEPRRAVDEERL